MENLKLLVKENRAPFARRDAISRCNKLNELFNENTLESFGLERTAETFQDIMQGGKECEKKIEEAISKELPINSKLEVIANAARKQLDKAIANFRLYVHSFKTTCAAWNLEHFTILPEYVQLNPDGYVELTAEGLEALDNKENLYLTTEKQVHIYNLCKKVKEDIETLQETVSEYGRNAFGTMGIMDLRLHDSFIDVDTIASFDKTIKSAFSVNNK